ncbi:MAG: phosphatase PAP2 family protein [Bacteroidales bacterium]|nr:phosphatase PAP2 family protein [Bacteroidales bacterium]
MRQISSKIIWLPLYLSVLFFIYKRFKLKKTILLLISFGFLIAFSDQISVQLFKNVFQRLRPCFNPEIQDLTHVLSLPGSRYGFVSSHAANSFAFAFLSLLIFRNKNYTIFILFWAFTVSYSRIYLGVHYPSDIIGGAVLGVFISALVYIIIKPRILIK